MDISDILIHLHPELSSDQRGKIEATLGDCNGVVSAHFNPERIHLLTVAYNPDLISSGKILEQTRQWDSNAEMAGL